MASVSHRGALARVASACLCALVVVCGASAEAHAGGLYEDVARGDLVVAPSLGLHFGKGAQRNPRGAYVLQENMQVTFWGGVTLHPNPQRTSLYGSLGVEVELSEPQRGQNATTVMPMLHLGWAYLGSRLDEEDRSVWAAATFPIVRVYGLLGVRPPFADFQPYAALRTGVGVNVPLLILLECPTTLELLHEVRRDGHQAMILRFGFSF